MAVTRKAGDFLDFTIGATQMADLSAQREFMQNTLFVF
ncbi:hypothetical protein PH5382_02866 [Phaeobacter sp. CECT 5382]|nr:hypothetical protein PH5382_02866 [Phaeobacter sp. CECT 5382]